MWVLDYWFGPGQRRQKIRCRLVNASVKRHRLRQKMKAHHKAWPCPDFIADIGKIKFTGKHWQMLAGLRVSMIQRNMTSHKTCSA